MQDIPDIGIRDIGIREIPDARVVLPPVLPAHPPVTAPIGFPVVEVPGCVESRRDAAGDAVVYEDDPRGNVVLCDGTMPSYNPLTFTPGTLTYSRTQPPRINPTKKPADVSSQPGTHSSTGNQPTPNVATELPCPPADSIPTGSKNKSQTAIVTGYEIVDGKCVAILEPLPLPEVIGNYLPGLPVVVTTASIAAVATTAAVFAKPLGDILLKLVKPVVKKILKKILKRRSAKPESLRERRLAQRDRNRALMALRRLKS